MNHPDIHSSALFAALADIPTQGRLDWTAREAAVWWRNTHAADRLRMRWLDERVLEIKCSERVRDLMIEILKPDGLATLIPRDVSPDVPSVMAIPE